MSDPLVVVPYDPKWIEQFDQERERIIYAFDDLCAHVEHIGSTSVPGLAAKPIVDMLIVVETAEDALRAITPLVRLGYTCYGEAEIPGRIYFDRRAYNPCHIHLYVRGNPAIERHLNFRDYLRTHSDTRDAYAKLKYELAEQFRENRPGYTIAKTEFIRGVEARAQKERANGRF